MFTAANAEYPLGLYSIIWGAAAPHLSRCLESRALAEELNKKNIFGAFRLRVT